MLTQPPGHVRSAPEAATLAGVTYRQLDYWQRKGWVSPSRTERVSKGRAVRLYSDTDVLRLEALAHFGRAKEDVAAAGPVIGTLELADGDVCVVARSGEAPEVVPAAELRSRVTQPGRWVVYDPAPLRGRLNLAAAPSETPRAEAGRPGDGPAVVTRPPVRRSA